jgi:hypothetical protein
MTDLSIGIISLAHAPVLVTDFSIVNVHIDELSSAQIWQHKLCATFYTNGNINCRLKLMLLFLLDYKQSVLSGIRKIIAHWNIL